MLNWSQTTIAHKTVSWQFRNVKASFTPHCRSLLGFAFKSLDFMKTSTALAFIDFCETFVMDDHTTVITKAIYIDIPSHLICWLTVFLTKRLQAVCYRDPTAPCSHSPQGCPKIYERGLCVFSFLLLMHCLIPLITEKKWITQEYCPTIDNRPSDDMPLQNILDRFHSWTQLWNHRKHQQNGDNEFPYIHQCHPTTGSAKQASSSANRWIH